jgi:uncharacterized protein (TIGR02217 family)
MSNTLYPVMPGLKWPVKRAPIWKTNIQESTSGREYRTRMMLYPRYKYALAYDFLRDTVAFNEFRPLMGLFNQMGGNFDTFLFDDLDDDTVTAQAFGVGDATTRTFQLVRTLGGFAEPVYDTNSTPLIYLNGVLKTVTTDYTINSTGGVTFTTAPGAGVAITWTGTYYWRCRFVNEQAEFDKFMKQLWQIGTVEMITVKP